MGTFLCAIWEILKYPTARACLLGLRLAKNCYKYCALSSVTPHVSRSQKHSNLESKLNNCQCGHASAANMDKPQPPIWTMKTEDLLTFQYGH